MKIDRKQTYFFVYYFFFLYKILYIMEKKLFCKILLSIIFFITPFGKKIFTRFMFYVFRKLYQWKHERELYSFLKICIYFELPLSFNSVKISFEELKVFCFRVNN